MGDAAILKPAFVLVGLTVVVFVRMYWLRLAEMGRGRISAQAVATSAEMARLLSDTRAADNFRNLFELPVLFYAAAFVAMLTDQVTSISLTLAWVFVVLRIAHSAVHCTYNRVVHRFLLYVAGALVLFTWWAYLAVGAW